MNAHLVVASVADVGLAAKACAGVAGGGGVSACATAAQAALQPRWRRGSNVTEFQFSTVSYVEDVKVSSFA